MKNTIITLSLLVALLLSGCVRPAPQTTVDPCLSIDQASLIRECQDH